MSPTEKLVLVIATSADMYLHRMFFYRIGGRFKAKILKGFVWMFAPVTFTKISIKFIKGNRVHMLLRRETA